MTDPLVDGDVVNSERFRTVLGNFATGVTVITALDGGEPVGMAANSFTSVSLDPALVSFCAAHSSRTYPRIAKSQRFLVNVLSEDQEDLARHFADVEADRFSVVTPRPSPLGLPILGDVVAWIECAIDAEHIAGDHTIVVGRVLAFAVDPTKLPLLYFRGKFAIEQPTN